MSYMNYPDENQYPEPYEPYQDRSQTHSFRMQEDIGPLDDAASVNWATTSGDRLPSTTTIMTYDDPGADNLGVFGATGGSDVLDYGTSQHNGPRETALERYALVWAQPNGQCQRSRQELATKLLSPFPTLDQLSDHGEIEPYRSNNEIQNNAGTPSDNSHESHWTSGESSAMSSQTSFDSRRDNMTESNSTLRPPLMGPVRPFSERRPSNGSINPLRYYSYGKSPQQKRTSR